MTIQELIDHFETSAIQFTPDPEYASEEWWLHFRDRLRNWLGIWYGCREVLPFLGRRWVTGLGPIYQAESFEAYEHWTDQQVDTLLAANSYKYKHLYDLYTAEYNPIWNVDGTETLTIHEEGNESGSDTRKTTGTERNQTTGSETTQRTGSDNTQNQTTTYDSDTDRDTDKQTISYGSSDTRTPNLTETRTPDITEIRTPNLGHEFDRKETRERGGNIGVTMTQQLEEAEFAWVQRMNLIRTIVRDIAECISYPFN